MKYIRRYMDMIKHEEINAGPDQKMLVKLIEKAFFEEDLRIDEDKVEKYFGLQKYFLYELFPWEKFFFVLHCCVYRADGLPRWPEAMQYVGRGTGKNGYTSFENFALLSPVNGIRNYHIQAFATAEENAKTSFMDLHQDVLEENKKKLGHFFKWNLETIRSIQTHSIYKYYTSNPKSKDGGRPGKVDFDEVHTFENSKLIDVAVTGLGKVADPRILYTSTDGYVRDGPLDNLKERGHAILYDGAPDNGFLPLMCYLKENEISDPDKWEIANPSLRYLPHLKSEMLREFEEYKRDPIQNSSFAVKRCNCPGGPMEGTITSWENIQACFRGAAPYELITPEIREKPCIICFDYCDVNDFLGAGILTMHNDIIYTEHMTWICKKSRDLHRIKFPLQEAVDRGDAAWIDDEKIDPEIPVLWVAERTKGRRILAGAADNYRFTYLKRACEDILHMKGEVRKASNGYGTKTGIIYLNRPNALTAASADISAILTDHRLQGGDSKIMRWMFNNIKVVKDKRGNVSYEKIEPKSRKTDTAIAVLNGLTLVDMLAPYSKSGGNFKRLGTRIY